MRNGQMRQVLNISKFEVDCLRQEKNPQAELKKIAAEKGPDEVAKLLKIADKELPDDVGSPAHEVNHLLVSEAKENQAIKNKDAGFFSWMEGQINKYASSESGDEKRGLVSDRSTQGDQSQFSKRFKPDSSSGEFSQHQSQTLICEKSVPNEPQDSSTSPNSQQESLPHSKDV